MSGRPALGASLPCDAVPGPLRPQDLVAWAEAVASLGCDYVSVGDHVVGVDHAALAPGRHEEWARHYPGAGRSEPYDHTTVFREPLTLLAFLAGRTSLGLATGALAMPQRQVVLLAKQAAEVHLLSAGRLRLGVGIGWSSIEYAALGVDFAARQGIFDEQLELLGRLWTEAAVDWEGRHHRVEHAGILVLPEPPPPLWIGGDGPRTLDRIGRWADGWHPPGRVRPGEQAALLRGRIEEAARAAGRDPAGIGLEARVFTRVGPDAMRAEVDDWGRHGLTHVCIDTRVGQERVPLAAHLERLAEAVAALRDGQ